MGISGLPALVRKSGGYSEEEKIPIDAYVRNNKPLIIWVDVLAVFFSKSKTAMLSFDHGLAFAKYLDALFSSIEKPNAVNAVNGMEDKTFCNVFFVIDGQRSEEKHRAHAERDKLLNNKLAKLDSVIKNHQSPGVVPTAKDLGKMQRLLKESKTSDYEQKKLLFTALKKYFTNTPGRYVHLCAGEADVYLAGKSDVVVLSKDSDLFCHVSVQCTLLPRIVGEELYVIPVTKAKLLDALNVKTPGHLALLGVISGIDYSANKKWHGITKNLEWYLDIVKARTPELTSTELMEAYIHDRQLAPNHFQYAERIFFHSTETLGTAAANAEQKSALALSETRNRLVLGVAALRATFRQASQAPRQPPQAGRLVYVQQNASNKFSPGQATKIIQALPNGESKEIAIPSSYSARKHDIGEVLFDEVRHCSNILAVY